MKTKRKPNIETTNTDFLPRIIEQALEAEKTRNVDSLRKALYPVWENLDKAPKIPKTDIETRAELTRLCGFFLGYYGHLKALPKYQNRGKDLLTKAIELFDSVNSIEGGARARLNLAWRYQQQGSHEEAAAILSYAQDLFGKARAHPVAVAVQIFECVILMNRGEHKKGLAKVTRLNRLVGKIDDQHLRAQFHIEAGFAYLLKLNYEKAAEQNRLAIETSRAIKNERFEAIALGNQASVMRFKCDFKKAHKFVEQAIEINVAADANGFLAHNYDTKALIFLDEGNYGRALAAIEKSISLFEHGQDYEGFARATANKAKILFKLQESTDALICLADAVSIAREKLSEAVAREYAEEFSGLFYVPGYNDFHADVAEFKKHILRDALVKSAHYMKKAAKQLKISQANLSDILRRQFPELFDELGIKKRKTRTMR